MIVMPKFDPFPHIVIEDFFNELEYDLVWKELMFLMPKMLPPDGTGASVNMKGFPNKKGSGVFVDHVYADRTFSDILNITRKMFCDEINIAAKSLDLFFKLYGRLTTDVVLAQLYYNGDYYKSHADASIFSGVTLLHKTPKQYTGGELIFPDYNYNVKLKNNHSIIFPSLVDHEVTEVKMQSTNPDDGRFTISQLMHIGIK